MDGSLPPLDTQGVTMERSTSRARTAAIATLVGGLIAAAPSFAQEPPARGAHHHGWRQMDPEARADRMEYMVKRMFSSVKASDEQKTQAGAIVRKASADLRPLEEQLRQGRRAAIELLARPSIDRNAIEAQRVQQAGLREAISKRMTQTLADLAEVLTPEQRASLAKRMSERFRGGRVG
jgi:periplasmic protein CpxP/Spy